MDDNPEGNYCADNEPSGCLQTFDDCSHGLERPVNPSMLTYRGWESAK